MPRVEVGQLTLSRTGKTDFPALAEVYARNPGDVSRRAGPAARPSPPGAPTGPA